MLAKTIELVLKNRPWVIGLFAVLALVGAWELPQLPIDAVPDITNVQVMINTKTGALDPEKVERQVSYFIETEMAGLPRIEEVRSLSKYGLSQVIAVFKEGTDIYWARQQVGERLLNVKDSLPKDTTPELAPMTTGLGEVFMYAVETVPGSELAQLDDTERLIRLRTVQDYWIKPRLRRVAGVADVDSNGGYKKQIHINLFPERLEKTGLTIEQVAGRLESLGDRFGGGFIQNAEGKQIIVRTDPALDSLQTIASIPLGLDVQGKPISVQNVAEVREDYAQRLGSATYRGRETVLGTVLMRVGANSRQVAHDSEATLKTMDLPPGVEVKTLYTRSFLVDKTIGTVTANLAEGAALVIAVLLLVLGSFRAALLVSLAIPLSMLIAAKGMGIMGLSANLMSLGAIDFGLLVDGSVVVVENILRRFGENAGESSSAAKRAQWIAEAVKEVARPVAVGLAMILMVYIPILYLQGVEGKMFRPMAITVCLALAGSLAVALGLMPALASLFLRPSSKRHSSETPFFLWLKRWYSHLLRATIRRRGPALGAAGVLILVAGLVALRMGADFVPSLDEGDMVLNLVREASQGIDASTKTQLEIDRAIAQFPEVETVFSRLGTPESATDPMGPGFADSFLILKKDRSQWRKVNGTRLTKDQLFQEIRSMLEARFPPQDISATQPIEMRFNEMLEGSRADVTLRTVGPDLKQLVELSAKAHQELSQVRGVAAITMDSLTALRQSPVLSAQLNYPQINRYGLSIRAINDILQLSMNGREIGSYFDQGVRFPILVHLDESLRNREEEIRSIPVGLPMGGTLPFYKLVDFRVQDQFTTIARHWGHRYAGVAVNVRGRDIASFVAEAKSRLAEKLPLPPGYEFQWGGQFRQLKEAERRLMVLLPLLLAALFLCLVKTLGNAREAILVFGCVPFACVGGVFALVLRGLSFSVSASIGFIALIGIALLNGVVLVTFFKETRRGEASLEEAVIRGALIRFRPVMMTALVAVLGFVPMALSRGIGAEVQRPLATVVVGGLITSTVLTLLLLPSAYLWVFQRPGRRSTRSAHSAA